VCNKEKTVVKENEKRKIKRQIHDISLPVKSLKVRFLCRGGRGRLTRRVKREAPLQWKSTGACSNMRQPVGGGRRESQPRG